VKIILKIGISALYSKIKQLTYSSFSSFIVRIPRFVIKWLLFLRGGGVPDLAQRGFGNG
jgi:hypothetical protein